MGKALDIIKKLEVKSFEWKDSGEKDVGLIAEEVYKIFPEAVWRVNGRIEGLRPLTLAALVIKAIQELQKETT